MSDDTDGADVVPLSGKGRRRKSPTRERAKQITEQATGQKVDERAPSQSSQLVALARARYELFMSTDGRPYGIVKGGSGLALPLRGRAGLRAQLAHLYTDARGGAVPSASALADAMTVLEGIAAAQVPRELHLRVARHGEAIVVDLGTPDGDCVIVRPGSWQREGRSPVLFRRSGAMRPLPRPVREGDGMARFANLINTGPESYQLLVGWLVAAFIPDIPHPILTFRGEQGTGKSTAAAMVIGIIDPSGAPKRTAPRDTKGWAVQAFHSWALALDNVSVIPDWLSDALCRAVTGDGVVDRALYSDDDVVVLEFRRVLALTTIDAGALAGDLAERLVTIELHTIPDDRRREELDLQAAYARAHAAILASLFDLLAQVLAVLPDVILTERPRMADFARILHAVDKVTGWTTLDTYRSAARDAVADVLDGDQFAHALITLVHARGEWRGTASELLEVVETPDRPPKTWPKDATRAGGRVKRLAPALRTIGIEVDDSQRGPKPKKQRLLHMTSVEGRRAAASPSVPGDTKPDLTSDDEGDADLFLQRPPSVPQGSPASPLPIPETERGDAAGPRGDAAHPASVPPAQASHLRKQPRGDARDAGDAETRLPSTDATSAGCCDCPNGRHGIHRPTCAQGGDR